MNNDELREELWLVVDYAVRTLKHNENEDKHWKVTLSLLGHKVEEIMQEMRPIVDEEE